ncbi:MAG: cytochrome c oxidase subunit 3 [Acidobacteriota bacterium]|nr:cytochrome c oxidase subunit 3 [Acidobacteriota bacterium]
MSEANLAMGAHPVALSEGSPFSVPTKKLVMWLFIISDAMTFAACLMAYGFLRNATPNWPHPFQFSPTVVNAMVMTFILVTSSLTMLIAVRAAQNGNKASAFNWILITAGGGMLFAILHIREWLGMIDEGATMFHNPWGTATFGASFYSITGLHLLHVTGGIVALIVVGLRYKGGRYNSDDIEILGLYWHFVDLVWMFVVPFVYLLNVAH